MSDPVRLVGTTRGAELEIVLSSFPEASPTFAYVDDTGAGVERLVGFRADGRVVLDDLPSFAWLQGPRDCVRLVATADGVAKGRASLLSRGKGEFCLEIYHVAPDGRATRLYANDFCFK